MFWRVSLLFLLACASVHGAGPEAEIRIKVTDTTAALVPGSLVTLKNLATGFERIGRTDPAGHLVFSGVTTGRYRVAAAAAGLAGDSVEFETSGTESVTLVLKPAPVVEQVTVYSGSRQEELREALNTRVEVIGPERLRDTGDESVAEVLRSVPGVLTRRGSETAGAAGEQVQGIDSRQVLVLLDGQPLVGARGIKRGVINLDRQPISYLDRIEVVKGASSALYGSDAIGGVINLISQDPHGPLRTSLTTSGGSYGTLETKADSGFSTDRVSGVFNFSRHKNNGFDLTPTTFDTTGAGLRRYSGMAKLQYRFNPDFRLTGSAHGYRNQQVGRSNGELGPQHDDDREQSQNYGLTADWQAAQGTRLQARGYFARYDEKLTNQLTSAPTVPLVGTVQERLGKIDATVSNILVDRQVIQAGGEWWTNRYRGDNRIRDNAGNRADTTVFWGQDQISLTGKAVLTLGGRYDRHSIFGSAFSPKAALTYRVGKGLSLRASYGRGFRAPDLGQLYYRFLNPTNFYQVIGNPNLRPEYADSWQTGAEFSTSGRRFRAGLNLFHNNVRHLIDSANLGFITTPQQLEAVMQAENIDPLFRPQLGRLLLIYKNLANATTRGVEFDSEISITKKFRVSGAYTFLDARDSTTHLRLTGRHRRQGHTDFIWTDARLGLRANLRGTFYSSWIAARSTSGSMVTDTVAPRFAFWDTYAAKTISRNVEVFGALDNLFNSRDSNLGKMTPTGAPAAIYRPEVGRTFRFGMRFTFNKES